MGNVLVQLIPPMIGSLMMPTWVLLVLFLLRSTRGVIKAVAFVGGVTMIRLLQGLLFGTALSAYAGLYGRSALQPVVSGLLLATGLLLWVLGVRRAFRREEPTHSLPTSLPTMHTLISAVTPPRALGLGVVLIVTSLRAWIFTLTALGTIGQAGLHTGQNIAAFLL
ncbi:MAG TPA: GAP family protein, partial [Ktedonobacterales bacterium]